MLEGAPDLYGACPLLVLDVVQLSRSLSSSRYTGPFWVPTTLVFSLFLTSSLYTSIAAYLDDAEYSYDFTRLGAATSVVCVPPSSLSLLESHRH